MKKRRINSMLVQIGAVFAMLLACVVALVALGGSFLARQNALHRRMEAILAPLSQVYTELDATRNAMAQLGFSRAEGSESLEDHLESLRSVAGELRDRMNEGGYNRRTMDLYYLVDGYVEQCAAAVASLHAGDYVQTIVSMGKRSQMEGFIREQMAAIGVEISGMSNEIVAASSAVNKRFQRAATVLGIACIVLVLFAAYYLSRRVEQPIRRIAALSERFRLTDDPVVLHDARKLEENRGLNEIRELKRAVMQMQERAIRQHSTELSNEALRGQLAEEQLRAVETEKQMQETRLMALQMQINPHFLFNTLNIISQMAYIEQADHTSELLETFSELFRYNVDKFDRNVPLKDELNNVEGYIRLQKARFGDRIEFSVRCDDELQEVRVPCLVNQPLVENAISHGLRNRTEGGTVDVAVYRNDREFILSVSDNGCGMNEETLYKLYNKVCGLNGERDDGEHTSIGLTNVYQRMRLFFGEQLRFSARSAPDEGFEIILHVPLKGGEPA